MKCGMRRATSDDSGFLSPRLPIPNSSCSCPHVSSLCLPRRAKRTPEQAQQLAAAYRSVSPLLDPTRKQIADLEESLRKLGIVTAMVMQEKPGSLRPATYIRERGSFMSKGDLVYADVPSSLNPLPKDAMPNRLGLAEWLVSEDNPLTARVTVNRYWETLFGHGIVETSEDYGLKATCRAIRSCSTGWPLNSCRTAGA